jgi:hypothetical protein
LNNQPLFVNDYRVGSGGKSFRVVNEPRINVVNFGGEMGYNIAEKFSIIAGVALNQYTGLQTNAKAWGLIPLELKGNLRLLVIKDLWLKADLFAWKGGKYMKKDGTGRSNGQCI